MKECKMLKKKFIGSLILITFAMLFTTCSLDGSIDSLREKAGGKGPGVTGGGDDTNGYIDPNDGIARQLAFSHNSGLYNYPFTLTLAAPVGSAIYYSIDGSIPSEEKAEDPANKYVFKYDPGARIAVEDRTGEPNILATKTNTENMYVTKEDEDKHFWDGFSTGYVPKPAQVPKATVIRAMAVYPEGNKSDVITKTYFIGNNLANYADHPIISLVTDPDNLVDEDIGIMVRGNNSNGWYTTSNPTVTPYNFQQKEWERPAYMELFSGSAGSRTVAFSTGVGIRVCGGYSRARAQKSLDVYFKQEYGINTLSYPLIPDAVKADGKTRIGTYKNFVLRNGENDAEYSKIFDRFVQHLLSDRNFSTQAQTPCIVYINGEYWGPYNIAEKYGDNHTEYKYGVKKANVISYDNDALDDGSPGDEHYYLDMIEYAAFLHDMSDPDNYRDFCDIVDIDNFIDYFAAQIYVFNQDWPHSNYRAWRTRTYDANNLPWGDTRWRFQMFDMDASLGVIDEGGLVGLWGGVDAFDQILNGYQKDSKNNRLIKGLLKNPDFCTKFVNNMMDLYNVNFNPLVYNSILTSYVDVYRNLMGDTTKGYFARWGYPFAYQGGPDDIGWDTAFDYYISYIKKFLDAIRHAMVENSNSYLKEYFGGYSGISPVLSGKSLCNVTLSAPGASSAPIKINTVTPNLNGSWQGKYYSGIPIPITANVPAGKTFDGWIVTGGTAAVPSSPTTTVTITGMTATITAKYK